MLVSKDVVLIANLGLDAHERRKHLKIQWPGRKHLAIEAGHLITFNGMLEVVGTQYHQNALRYRSLLATL